LPETLAAPTIMFNSDPTREVKGYWEKVKPVSGGMIFGHRKELGLNLHDGINLYISYKLEDRKWVKEQMYTAKNLKARKRIHFQKPEIMNSLSL
jgi:hypothetical protein